MPTHRPDPPSDLTVTLPTEDPNDPLIITGPSRADWLITKHVMNVTKVETDAYGRPTGTTMLQGDSVEALVVGWVGNPRTSWNYRDVEGRLLPRVRPVITTALKPSQIIQIAQKLEAELDMSDVQQALGASAEGEAAHSIEPEPMEPPATTPEPVIEPQATQPMEPQPMEIPEVTEGADQLPVSIVS